MTDWADGIEIRNNGIKCVIDTRTLSELLRTIIALGMIAAALLFYSWVRTEIRDIGYESQKLFEIEKKLTEEQKNLILVEETLKDPTRIDQYVREELGMTKLHPSQVIKPQPRIGDRGIPDSLAMTGSESDDLQSGESKRFGSYYIN
jgi:cell division protein FtsL